MHKISRGGIAAVLQEPSKELVLVRIESFNTKTCLVSDVEDLQHETQPVEWRLVHTLQQPPKFERGQKVFALFNARWHDPNISSDEWTSVYYPGRAFPSPRISDSILILFDSDVIEHKELNVQLEVLAEQLNQWVPLSLHLFGYQIPSIIELQSAVPFVQEAIEREHKHALKSAVASGSSKHTNQINERKRPRSDDIESASAVQVQSSTASSSVTTATIPVRAFVPKPFTIPLPIVKPNSFAAASPGSGTSSILSEQDGLKQSEFVAEECYISSLNLTHNWKDCKHIESKSLVVAPYTYF
jgi:hypothetical protein